MKYYPRLKVWKASNHEFNGHKATSYNWFVYAIRLLDGTFVMTENTYSSTTSGHMSDFCRTFSVYNFPGDHHICLDVLAPCGLNQPETGRKAIQAEIKTLQAELANKRTRARQRRIDRIAKLEAMIPIWDIIEADYAAREQLSSQQQITDEVCHAS